MARKTLTPDLIVRIEKSGNRFNAWDTDGNKRTSEITTTTRRKAHEGDYLLGRFTGRTGKTRVEHLNDGVGLWTEIFKVG
jgi:hypothetical protein